MKPSKLIPALLSALLVPVAATATTFTDDVIIQSADVDLFFNDTDSSSTYWSIGINEECNDCFSIQNDVQSPLLFLNDSNDNLGLGTSNPAVEIHTVDGNTPGLRLEQDTSSGFSPQTWDVAGNEVGFFIRDVSNGSQLPLRIRPGAPSSSIDVSATGDVGIGKSSPAEKLDVNGTIQSTFTGSQAASGGLVQLFKMSSDNSDATKNSDVGFAMENVREDFAWTFRTYEGTGGNAKGFIASKLGSGGPEFTVENPTGVYSNVVLRLGNGARNENGQWINASSRAWKDNIEDLRAEDAITALEQLTPVTYTFKNDKDKEMNVGFIAEDTPDLIATKDRKGLNPLEIVAMLTKVVKEQQKTLAQQQELLDSLIEEREANKQSDTITTSLLTE